MVDVTPVPDRERLVPRRERLRTATLVEIKQAARRLLVEGGPHAISLRAIARDMGMTAPAIYRYFDSLDALIFELAGDLYDEMRETVVAARDVDPAADPIDRLVSMARAFRRWSLANPAEFGLLFGAPLPGIAAFEEDCHNLENAGARFGAAFIEVFAQLPTPPAGSPLAPPPEVISADLLPCAGPLFTTHGDLPPALLYLYLNAWVRLYGLVAMEVFGHLKWGLSEVEPLFETEVAAFVHQLTGTTARKL